MEEFREFLLRWLDDQLIQMIIVATRGRPRPGGYESDRWK